MDNDDACKLTCSHRFCHSCVKGWYTKGNSTCPMCRRPMYFRGFSKTIRKWEDEKLEQMYADVYSESMELILSEWNDSSETESETQSETQSEHDSDAETVGESDSESEWEEDWADAESVASLPSPRETTQWIHNFFNVKKTVMDDLRDMDKKFKKFKDILDPEDLYELINYPSGMYVDTMEFVYEDLPVVQFTKKTTHLSKRGVSRRRARKQSPSVTSSYIILIDVT